MAGVPGYRLSRARNHLGPFVLGYQMVDQKQHLDPHKLGSGADSWTGPERDVGLGRKQLGLFLESC